MRIHFAILPAQHARQLASVRERERGRERGGECCSRVAVTGAVAGADTVAGLGANVFTPKRFRVHGDTLVWRPLTVNTYIWMCSYAQQIAAPLLSSSLSLSPLPSHMCEKFHVALFWQNANDEDNDNNERGLWGEGGW